MWNAKAVIYGIVLGCVVFCGQRVIAQEKEQDADSWTPGVVKGEAFSAVKYTRMVRMQPDGRRVTVARGHRILVARNADGRVFMAGADRAETNCYIPSMSKLPLCDSWSLLLFDPSAKMMWHWSDGETADKAQMVLMDLQEDQIAEAERKTSVLPRPPENSPADGVSVRDLGERNIGGIVARGTRATVEQKEADGRTGQRIHEVWSSAKFRLVLRVIDGDPMGEETIAGLLKISLMPDPALFRPPSARILRHWKNSSIYAVDDITYRLSYWPVN